MKATLYYNEIMNLLIVSDLFRIGSMIALDVGRSRVGIAGCDATGIAVTPLLPLLRSTIEQDLIYLREIIRKRCSVALIIGLPLSDSNQVTIQAIHCRRYGKKLAQKLQLPVAWVNEHSSSWNAAELHNLSYDRSGHLDSMVAYMLLEQWLNEKRKSQSTLTITGSAN
ncbi:MAG TPA: Holliday junction resolvase RuvX [Prochlorococcaceae cyanobacterium AMR_MDS_5431]|nr:Holliday junction resolvase RuvX [Prochlorococcaceae cyanobacterium AMR_MDS_5431]